MDTEITRTFVSDVTRDLAALDGPEPSEAETRLATLRASWGRLVQHLALGEAPELRQCPACDRSIMKAATRCMHCWTQSVAPQSVAPQSVAPQSVPPQSVPPQMLAPVTVKEAT